MGHGEGVVPGVAFDEALAVGAQHVELGAKTAVGQARAHGIGARGEYVLPVGGALAELLVGVGVAEFPGELGNAPVVVSIFKGGGNGGAAALVGHVAAVDVLGQAVVPAMAGSGHAGGQGALGLSGSDCTIQHGIGHYGGAVVAALGPVGGAGVELERAGGGHEQEVTQI